MANLGKYGANRYATAPATFGEAVTPSDATVLTPTRGIYVGGDGDLAVTFADGGSVVTFVGLIAGTLLPISVSKVMAATTATSIVALY